MQGVPVVYSLGNFWFNSKEVPTGMIRVTLTQDGVFFGNNIISELIGVITGKDVKR